jgi:hypothetical protein
MPEMENDLFATSVREQAPRKSEPLIKRKVS